MNRFTDEVHNLILYKMENEELSTKSLEALKNVLEENKTNTKVIEEELEACKRAHKDMREEMNNLLKENRNLSAQLKATKESEISVVTSKAHNLAEWEVEAVNDRSLELILEEKNLLKSLWKESYSQISLLEEQLQEYKSGNQLIKAHQSNIDLQKDYTEAIQILDARCSSLRHENDQLAAKTQLLENEVDKLMTRATSFSEKNLALENSLREVTARERELKTKYLTLEANFLQLDRSYQADKTKFANVYKYEKAEEGLRKEVREAERARDELQAALEHCHENMAKLLRDKAENRARLEEAVALADAALRSRDEAMEKEAASTEEVKRLKKELTSQIKEAGVRVEQETAAVVKQFETKLGELTHQLDVSHRDGLRKSAEIKQLQKECGRLQDLLSQKSASASKSNSRDKELNRLYHELRSSETECLQLKLENESFEDGFKILQDKCRRNSREKERLREELRTTRHQLQLCQHELSLSTQRAELLNSQLYQANYRLAHMQSEPVVLEAVQDQTSNPDMKVVSTTKVIELYRRFEDSYGQMNTKWKTEMTALTEKFDAKLKKKKSKLSGPKVKEKTNTSTDFKPSEDNIRKYNDAVKI